MSDAPNFEGDLEGFLKYSEEHPHFNPDWCPRHWAPCPVDRKPGLLAAVLLVQCLRFRFIPEEVGTDALALNSWMENQTTPTCCKAGDDEVQRIWDLASAIEVGDVDKTNELKTHFGLPLDKAPFPRRIA